MPFSTAEEYSRLSHPKRWEQLPGNPQPLDPALLADWAVELVRLSLGCSRHREAIWRRPVVIHLRQLPHKLRSLHIRLYRHPLRPLETLTSNLSHPLIYRTLNRLLLALRTPCQQPSLNSGWIYTLWLTGCLRWNEWRHNMIKFFTKQRRKSILTPCNCERYSTTSRTSTTEVADITSALEASLRPLILIICLLR